MPKIDLKKLAKIDPVKMSREERQEVLKGLRELKRVQDDADPFWSWEPIMGDIGDRERELLLKWLKPEDVPLSVDSQLDVLLSDAEIRGVSGGNRSSKSETGCVGGIIRATGELPLSLLPYKEKFQYYVERAGRKFINGRVTAVDSKQLHRVVLPKWKRLVPRGYLKNGKWEDSYSMQFDILTLYRNKKPCAMVEFLTNEQKVKSSQGGDLDFAIFDEQPDSDKWKETLMRFGTAERLDIEIDWTPTEGLSWATDLFHARVEDEDIKEDKIELFKLTPVTNPYVNSDTLIKIMDNYEKVSSYEEMKMRLLGEAISLSGLVYGSLFSRKVHVIEPFYENVKNKKDYLCLFGGDPHLVTPFAGVFMLVDRENICYIDRCYFKEIDIEDFKQEFWDITREYGYNIGWSVVDKSSDSSIMAFGGLNIFNKLRCGSNALPGLRTSEKYQGSIKAGVDEIKKRLKSQTLMIVNRPENRDLINSFFTLERETYVNEDKKGQKDRIAEGRHHLHAALRYLFQFPIIWYEKDMSTPEYQYFDEAVMW